MNSNRQENINIIMKQTPLPTHPISLLDLEAHFTSRLIYHVVEANTSYRFMLLSSTTKQKETQLNNNQFIQHVCYHLNK